MIQRNYFCVVEKCENPSCAFLFLSLAFTAGDAQHFVSTMAPVGSSTVRIIITAPRLKPVSDAKSNDAGSSLHTGNEWMIEERSHFTEKNQNDYHFICQQQHFSPHCAETIGLESACSHVPKSSVDVC